MDSLLWWWQIGSHAFVLVADALMSFIAITTLLNRKGCEILFQSSACELCSLHFEVVEELFLSCENWRFFGIDPSRFLHPALSCTLEQEGCPLQCGRLYFSWFGTANSSLTVSSPCLLRTWNRYRETLWVTRLLRDLVYLSLMDMDIFSKVKLCRDYWNVKGEMKNGALETKSKDECFFVAIILRFL